MMKTLSGAMAAILIFGAGCIRATDQASSASGDTNGIAVATYAIPENIGTVTHDPEIPAIGRFMTQHGFSWSGRINDSNMVIRVVPSQAETARRALLKAVQDGELRRVTLTE